MRAPEWYRVGQAIAATFAIVGALVAAAAPPPVEKVVLVTIDTWRADALGASGSRKVATPNLDRLAAAGWYAPAAWASSTLTTPSHATILTGLEPYRHGIRDNHGFRLDPSVVTLPQALAARGYESAAFVSALPLSRSTGLDRGFRVYDDRVGQGGAGSVAPRSRAGARTLDAVEAWLRRAPRRYFLWVHLYEPHAPYEPPEPYHARYARAPYYGEVAYTDDLLGRLVRMLGPSARDGALLVIAGDHGESLGEHAEAAHGLHVYDSTARVPLIVKGPRGRMSPSKLAAARLVDVMPTILSLCGVRVPDGLDGRVLGGGGTAPLAYVETLYPALNFGAAPVRALSDGATKVIDVPRKEVFDLRRDPGETRNTWDVAPNPAADALFDRLARLPATPSHREAAETSESLAALRSLGYVGAGAGLTLGRPGMDPKDFAPLHAKLERARERVAAGRAAEARPLYDELLRAFPGSSLLAAEAGFVAAATGDIPQAEAQFRRALAADPRNAEALLGLANVRVSRGDFPGAEALFLKVLEADPDDPEANFNLGALYYERMKRPDRAEPYWSRFLALRPDDPEAAAIRARLAAAGPARAR